MHRLFFSLLLPTYLFCAEDTRYGTFSFDRKSSISEHDVYERLLAARYNEFAELPLSPLLNEKEICIHRAYNSADNPFKELISLSAQARTSNWHPVYIQVLDTLIECAKTL